MGPNSGRRAACRRGVVRAHRGSCRLAPPCAEYLLSVSAAGVRCDGPERQDGRMPLEGTYEPSPDSWVREQVELYESSGGTEGNTLRDVPVIVITSRGAKSG